jgi:TfoX/Sxy family transcriptional regulator of competence genes
MEEIVTLCGRDRSGSGKPYTAESKAQHEKVCGTCQNRKHAFHVEGRDIVGPAESGIFFIMYVMDDSPYKHPSTHDQLRQWAAEALEQAGRKELKAVAANYDKIKKLLKL